MCGHSFASHRLMLNALSLCSCFRASDPALFAVDGSLLRAVNCARRRPLCEEKDDNTTAYRHLSPRTVAEISGVLFKERCLIKPTVLTHLISRKGTGFLPVLAARRLNSTGITPDPLVSLPGVVIVPAWSFFGVSFDARSRGAAKPDATWSHPIPTAALAMNRRRFQIVWPLAPL